MVDSEFKKEIGSRIKNARENKGISRKQLASLTNTTVSTISNWELGIRTPDWEKAEKLGELLDANPALLLCFDIKLNLGASKETNTRLKIQLPDGKVQENQDISIPSFISYNDPDLIAIKCTDDSMQPLYRKNDIVIFKKSIQDLSLNKVALVKANDSYMIRKLVIKSGKVSSLVPLNDSWPEIKISNEKQLDIIAIATDRARVFY